MKPTRFMASSPEMINQLSRQCDGQHAHQHLEGSRAAAAAYYPMEFAVSILRGMRDETAASVVDEDQAGIDVCAAPIVKE